jgi:hypothetical protein
VESPNSQRRKMERHVQSKVKSVLIIFFDIKGIVNKGFVLAGQTVNSKYYCDVLRRFCERIRPNYVDKRTGCCSTTTHRLTIPFSPGNFRPKTTWLSSPSHSIFLFPLLKMKLKAHHFDTIEVMEARSQGALNTLTVQNSRMP